MPACSDDPAIAKGLPKIPPLPFLAAPKSDVGGGRGEGPGEGSVPSLSADSFMSYEGFNLPANCSTPARTTRLLESGLIRRAGARPGPAATDRRQPAQPATC